MKYAPIAIICSAALISACSDQPTYQKIEGQTMGTGYHISYQHPDGVDAKVIQASIDQRLQAINISMSTYMDDSTISKFNRLPSATPIEIGADFAKVLSDSQSIYQASNQAFDPTVYPLVELWGFGKQMSVERLQSPPNADEIAKAKAVIGLDKVVVNGQSIQKTVDGVGVRIFLPLPKAMPSMSSPKHSKTAMASQTIWLRLVVKSQPLDKMTKASHGHWRWMRPSQTAQSKLVTPSPH